jgi:hypothetical protein
MAMDSDMFCSSSIRVSICRLDTNLCCYLCSHVVDCRAACKSQGLKVVPCVVDPGDFDCEFQI